MTPQDLLVKLRFTGLGLYFGYPQCCIDEFVKGFIAGTGFKRKKRKLNGTGYVPCAACNKKSEKQLLKTIATNRKHAEPFPNQDDLSDKDYATITKAYIERILSGT